MKSLILTTATTYLLPLLLLLSVFLVFHGHDSPGGGFVGGLVASAAFALYMIGHGVENAQRMIRVSPRTLIGLGLLIAFMSGCLALVAGKPFLTGLWAVIELPVAWKIGTPVLFDIGVYFVVVGATLMIIFSLGEE
jgi:multicomponent Na+:H+ antiporter subunit B